ncbi:MAG: E3 binding domain-containing protein, partial [Caldilinea sp.]|nr:E3 binding domain-containing protein [Caldilinea sp.]MDW8442525.1 E3 binding domain-containing protein [Caldilineaceae bacterium]
MPYELTLPPIGSKTEEGIVVAWFKREGAPVRKGEPLLEVQFDKVSTEVESPVDGSLLQILAPRDAVIRQGQTLAILLLTEEAAVAKEAPSAAPSTEVAQTTAPGASTFPASPAARRLARELGVDLTQVIPANGERITEEDVRRVAQERSDAAPSARPPGEPPPQEVRATPLAKRMAREHGVDLSALRGSGPGGRIVEQDVQAAIEARAAQAPTVTPQVMRQPLSPMRRAIARRMMESLHSTAQLTMTMQADVTALVEARETWKPALDVTYTDLIVRAVALALRQHPSMTVRWAEDAVERPAEIHIGVAV